MAKDEYEVYKELREEALLARITRRRNPRGFFQYSFQIVREYERDGQQLASNWLNKSHTTSAKRLIQQVHEVMSDAPAA